MTKQQSLEDLASPLSKLRVNPLPSEFGAYNASGSAGPSRYALQDPGVASGGSQEVCIGAAKANDSPRSQNR